MRLRIGSLLKFVRANGAALDRLFRSRQKGRHMVPHGDHDGRRRRGRGLRACRASGAAVSKQIEYSATARAADRMDMRAAAGEDDLDEGGCGAVPYRAAWDWWRRTSGSAAR